MKRLVAGIVGSLLLAGAADASVLCARPRKSGALEGNVKIRAACRPGEVQLAPEDVGFCCTLPPSSTTTSSVTTSSTTTGACPTYTSTTLGVPDCYGAAGSCMGLCANARTCVPDAQTGVCGCTGAVRPCGSVTYNGLCGGSCPDGQTCQLYGPPGPDGCPGEPHCVCVP
jgi:hypothetical protein